MAGTETTGGFTTGELQLANWWVRNHLALNKAYRAGLILLNVLLWGYSAWGLLDAFVISYPREKLITRDTALNVQLLAGLETDRPQSMDVSDAEVFQTTDGRIDMVSEVTNNNAQWWAEFNYRFTVGGEEEAPLRTGYVLPGETQIITELGYKPQTKGSRQASVDIENVRWHRVDPQVVASGYESYKKDRVNLVIDNVKYDGNVKLGNKTVGQTSFTISNQGAFGFWNVDLIVRLMRGGRPGAVTKLTLTNLSPGEKRDMQIVWVDNPPSVQQTEVIPQINVLDQASYLPTQYFK